MKGGGWLIKVSLILWMAGCAFVFFLVTLGPDDWLAGAMPSFVMKARSFVLTFFSTG